MDQVEEESQSPTAPSHAPNEPMSPVAQPSDSLSLANNSDHSSQNPGVLHGRILEKGDRVRHTFRIGRVTGLDAYEGKISLMKS